MKEEWQIIYEEYGENYISLIYNLKFDHKVIFQFILTYIQIISYKALITYNNL